MERTNEITATFTGEDGDILTVHYDNRGEPYREGVTLSFLNEFTQESIGVFLRNHEVQELFTVLGKYMRYAELETAVKANMTDSIVEYSRVNQASNYS
jgi:hypothetical protein